MRNGNLRIEVLQPINYYIGGTVEYWPAGEREVYEGDAAVLLGMTRRDGVERIKIVEVGDVIS